MREKTFMVMAFVVGGALLYGGRDLLPSSVLGTWVLTFGGTTALALLMVSVYRLQLELKASRHALARNEAEISFALQVQKALFPRELPTCGGLEFSAVCIPARGISGDYYDILNLSGDRLAFAIADISGKGIPAAILMANLQALLRTLADNHESPQEMCSRLNSHLHRVTESSRFATFFYAEYNAGTRHIRYVNAGHNPPILLGSRNGQTLDCGGFPLGLLATQSMKWENSTCSRVI